MLVRAIELGHYGNKRRKEGDVFKIKSEKDFSNRWMEKVEVEPKEEETLLKAIKKGKGKKTAATVFKHEEEEDDLDAESSDDVI